MAGKLVKLDTATYAKSRALKEKLEAKAPGANVTLGAVIGRALECFEDSIDKKAWLSPDEARPVYEEIAREQKARLIVDVVKLCAPDLRITKITYSRESQTFTIDVEGKGLLNLQDPAALLKVN